MEKNFVYFGKFYEKRIVWCSFIVPFIYSRANHAVWLRLLHLLMQTCNWFSASSKESIQGFDNAWDLEHASKNLFGHIQDKYEVMETKMYEIAI